ncbi:MAG: hypothetical protein LBC27_09720 [Spirochaetaceae bacterium]|jgi:phosphate/sulfate permease|nr:hypothetical protein [Spirochaetaceae bacterium]
MNNLTATRKQPVLSAEKIVGALLKTGIAFVLGVWAVLGQTTVFFLLFFAYSVYLAVSFFSFIKKTREKSGACPDTDEQKTSSNFAGALNSFVGRHIDDILINIPPPASSVKHEVSSFICYYWAVSGDETLTLFVEPKTSRVVRWTYTGR